MAGIECTVDQKMGEYILCLWCGFPGEGLHLGLAECACKVILGKKMGQGCSNRCYRLYKWEIKGCMYPQIVEHGMLREPRNVAK